MRNSGVVFAALLLGWGSVSCGGGAGAEDPSKMTPAAAVAKAAEKSEAVTSLHYRIAGTVPGRGRLEAEASMNAKPVAMSMKVTASAAQRGDRLLEVRFVDKVMYVGGSVLRPEKMKGKNWFSAAPAVWGSGGAYNQSYRLLPSQLQANPTAQSRLLTASKDLRVIGTETVDGVTTTHYKGTVYRRGLLHERLDQFMQLHISDPLTMDLWIDTDDLPRQFRMRGEHNEAYAGTGPLDLTVTFLDIDEPVTIAAPPAGDTAPIGDGVQGG